MRSAAAAHGRQREERDAAAPRGRPRPHRVALAMEDIAEVDNETEADSPLAPLASDELRERGEEGAKGKNEEVLATGETEEERLALQRRELANRVHLALEHSSDTVPQRKGNVVYQRFAGTGGGGAGAHAAAADPQPGTPPPSLLQAAVHSPSGVHEQIQAQLEQATHHLVVHDLQRAAMDIGVGLSEQAPPGRTGEEQNERLDPSDASHPHHEPGGAHTGAHTAPPDGSRAQEPLHEGGVQHFEESGDGVLRPTEQQHQEPQHQETHDGDVGFERKGSASSSASEPAMQVPAMGAFMVPKVREVSVMGSECMREEPTEASDPGMQWIRWGLRGRGFQSSLQSAQVPPLKLGQVSRDSKSSVLNRVITFHELFGFADPPIESPSNLPLPGSRATSRGLLSRGRTMSQTPTTRKRLLATPRAQTAREHEGWRGRGDASTDMAVDGLIVKPASARHSSWDYGLLEPDDLREYLQDGRYSPDDHHVSYSRQAQRPTVVQMPSRGSAVSRDSVRSNGMIFTPQWSRRASPRGKFGTLVDHVSRRLFGHQHPYGDEKVSKAERTSYVDAQQVGSASSGLFSVIQPRERKAVVTPRSARLHDKEDISTSLHTRRLICAPSIDLRVRLTISDELRREQYKQQWSRIERQTRDLWEPKLPPHAIEEVTATNPKARQKLAMIRRFCEISAPDNDEELASLYYRWVFVRMWCSEVWELVKIHSDKTICM